MNIADSRSSAAISMTLSLSSPTTLLTAVSPYHQGRVPHRQNDRTTELCRAALSRGRPVALPPCGSHRRRRFAPEGS